MGNFILKEFKSALEFLEWATHAPCMWRGELKSREISPGNTLFTATKNYEEAYSLAKYGWREGVEKLTQQVDVAASHMDQPVQQLRYGIAGYYPSPARAAAGEPFSMVRKGGSFKSRPSIHIEYGLSANCNVAAETIIAWGAALSSYIDRLELADYMVQLDGSYELKPFSNDHEFTAPDVCFRFPIKKAGDPLSLSDMVFWLAHPSALRRICFSACERLDIQRWYDKSYGCATDLFPARHNVLRFSIDDAGYDVQTNLDVIRAKHSAMQPQGGIPERSPHTSRYGHPTPS